MEGNTPRIGSDPNVIDLDATAGLPANHDDAGRGEPERRRAPRWNVCWSASISGDEHGLQCLILNLSRGGAKIGYPAPLRVGSAVTLQIRDHAPCQAVVAWWRGYFMGLQFKNLAAQAAEALERRLSGAALAS